MYLPSDPAAMTRQSVPEDEQFAGNVTLQVGQKLDHLRALDASRKYAEVKVPPRYSRHGG
jgi:hypothetical protein